MEYEYNEENLRRHGVDVLEADEVLDEENTLRYRRLYEEKIANE